MPEPWERLAAAMGGRLTTLELNWRQVAARADISEETLRNIRRGRTRITPAVARGLERALEWEPLSVSQVLAGGRAVPAEATAPPVLRRAPGTPGRQVGEAVRALHAAIDKLTRDTQDQIAAEILAARERWGPDAKAEQVFPGLPDGSDRQVDRAIWTEGAARGRPLEGIIADIAEYRTRHEDPAGPEADGEPDAPPDGRREGTG